MFLETSASGKVSRPITNVKAFVRRLVQQETRYIKKLYGSKNQRTLSTDVVRLKVRNGKATMAENPKYAYKCSKNG